jgi:hypothetical protein
MPFTFKADQELLTQITDQNLTDFMQEIVGLLHEIFDAQVPFEEKL